MKRILTLAYANVLLMACLALGSCSKDVKIGNYPDPSPSSIYNLRRVEMKDGLLFGETSFQAVVTSDIAGGNFDNRILVLQDMTGDAAISVELPAANNSLEKNDVVKVNLKGASLQNKAGELLLVNLPLSQITATGEKKAINPKSTTIAALLANAKYWGPILVKLDKVNIFDGSSQLSGELLIDDDIAEMKVYFAAGSVFSSEANPGFVESLIGIPYLKGTDWTLYPRDLDDIQVGLSELLEDFEQGKYDTPYDLKIANFATGSWTLDGAITATSGSDPKNGKQCIRIQGTVGSSVKKGIVSMNFDLTGVKTISVSHGLYPAAAELANTNPTVIAVEVSKDGGQTYESLGTAEIDPSSTVLRTNTFQVNAGDSEEVRFRIVNISTPLPNNNLPRLTIDDILFTF